MWFVLQVSFYFTEPYAASRRFFSRLVFVLPHGAKLVEAPRRAMTPQFDAVPASRSHGGPHGAELVEAPRKLDFHPAVGYLPVEQGSAAPVVF